MSGIVKALEGVIIPALSEADSLAQEQAAIALSHLRMMSQLSDSDVEYEQHCLRKIESLAEDLVSSASGQGFTRERAESLARVLGSRGTEATRPRPSAAKRRRNEIARAIASLVEASGIDGDESFVSTSQRLILNHGKIQADLDRSRYAAAGLDPEAGTLPQFEALMSLDED
ncbi:hypothetical protein [Rhodococcus rhodochrous]|uniref:hypothetical protein n=1 Tax=Rhodococcus rhodochrous TaxID=1829 RepID=UPI000A1CC1AC|nr:hypothetical protein [Rhodococcus rhodochrous]MBF4479307.1 hypothetical protein [Rhodococcus rhodochrous]MCD2100484.1 hypothetical protein [Rhodococcus rhodochrous]MCD2124819.1 hypothetical protein [Rhodococcus rhodochrous]MCQ4138188.1 hypothetical protein [Rhodococcus rhodochrous]MDJ0021460.1 hypothetical protein [Rhodococcus rhodochrous]